MDDQNRELLGKVVKDRLEEALTEHGNSDEDRFAFKEAMEAVTKQIELDKIDMSHQAEIRKQNMENDKNIREELNKLEEAQKDRWVQIGIFVAGLIASPLIEVASKKAYAKMLCEFEKDYTFTTSAGRSLSGLFKFKK